MGRTRASRTVCLRCVMHIARTDTIGILAARVRLRLVRSRSHDVTARKKSAPIHLMLKFVITDNNDTSSYARTFFNPHKIR